MISKKTKQALFRFAAPVLAILGALGLAEAAIRVSGYWMYPEPARFFVPSRIAGVPYLHRPGLDLRWAGGRIVTNREGLRNRADYAPDHPGVYRILVLGDSYTFGFGVDQDQAFPQQLETVLNARSRDRSKRYEVVNAGFFGFNAPDESRLLEYLLPRYRPDLVLWCLFNNDYDDSEGYDGAGGITSAVPAYEATCRYLELVWGHFGPILDPGDMLFSVDDFHRAWAKGKPLPARGAAARAGNALLGWTRLHGIYQGYRQYRAKLAQVETCARTAASRRAVQYYVPVPDEHGVLKTLPLPSHVDMSYAAIFYSPYYRQRFHAALLHGRALAASRGIPLLLISMNAPIEAGASKTGPDLAWSDLSAQLGMQMSAFLRRYQLKWDAHMNARGNRLFAEGLARLLSEKQYVPSAIAPIQPFDADGWWKAYWKSRAGFAKILRPSIDFARFQGINQIVGGLRPSLDFPVRGKPGSRLSVILRPNGGRRLRIEGDNRAAAPLPVVVYCGTDDSGTTFPLELAAGHFQAALDLPPAMGRPGGEGILDVQMWPARISNPIQYVKLTRLGLDSPASMPVASPAPARIKRQQAVALQSSRRGQ